MRPGKGGPGLATPSSADSEGAIKRINLIITEFSTVPQKWECKLTFLFLHSNPTKSGPYMYMCMPFPKVALYFYFLENIHFEIGKLLILWFN